MADLKILKAVDHRSVERLTDLYTLANVFHLANSNVLAFDAATTQIHMKSPNGTNNILAVNDSGKLTINGAIVGLQS